MSVSFFFIFLRFELQLCISCRLQKIRSLKILWSTCSKWASSKQEQFSSGFNDLEANKYNKRKELNSKKQQQQLRISLFFGKTNIVLILFGVWNHLRATTMKQKMLDTRNAVTERRTFHVVPKYAHGIEHETNKQNDN